MVTNDLAEVIDYLGNFVAIPTPLTPHMAQTAKRVHAFTYSLILWRFRLSGLPASAKPFIEEIASDALQILPQVLMGYNKTVKLLARASLRMRCDMFISMTTPSNSL